MGTRVDDGSLDGLTPYQRQGFVHLETEEGSWHLARNEYDALETAIIQKKEVFIGKDPHGDTVIIRLRRGIALTVDFVVERSPAAIAAEMADKEAQKFKND